MCVASAAQVCIWPQPFMHSQQHYLSPVAFFPATSLPCGAGMPAAHICTCRPGGPLAGRKHARPHTSRRCAPVHNQMHPTPCAPVLLRACRPWAAWAGCCLAAALQARTLADASLTSSATPLSWQETVVEGGGSGGLDGLDGGDAGLLLGEPGQQDMRFMLPACPSYAVLALLHGACQEVGRAGAQDEGQAFSAAGVCTHTRTTSAQKRASNFILPFAIPENIYIHEFYWNPP